MISTAIKSTINQNLAKSRSFLAGNQFFSNYFSLRSATGVSSANAVKVDSSGNIHMLAGRWIYKMNSEGISQWQKELQSGATFSDIDIDSSGNVYLGGTAGVSGRNQEMCIVKLNSSGVSQWQRFLGDASSNDFVYSIKVAPSGNVYGGGLSIIGGLGPQIVKYDSSGTLQWQIRWSTGDTAYVRSIDIDSSENVYVGMSAVESGYFSTVIAKYNSSGTLQWQRKLSATTTSVDAGGIVVNRTTGDLYITGQVANGNYLFVAKYNTSGTLQWQRRLSGPSIIQNNFPQPITIDSTGDIYIGFLSGGASSVVKYNSSGTLQWQRGFASSNASTGGFINLDNNGNYYLILESMRGFIKAPADGSRTGVSFLISGVTYQYNAITLTDATGTLTGSTSSFSQSASSLGATTLTLTVSNVSETILRANW